MDTMTYYQCNQLHKSLQSSIVQFCKGKLVWGFGHVVKSAIQFQGIPRKIGHYLDCIRLSTAIGQTHGGIPLRLARCRR